MKELITIQLCLFLALLSGGCIQNQSTNTNENLEPAVEYLNLQKFEKAEEVIPEKQFIEVPSVKLQEGQLKPLPVETRVQNVKEDNFGGGVIEPVKPKNNIEIVAKPVPIPIPSKKNKSLLTKADKELIAGFARKTVMQTAVVGNAKKRSQVTPSPLPENWINAITVYDYMEGALFQVYLTPNRTTDILFAPGEQLISSSAGDTLRWIVGETESGSGKDKRSHLLVKPKHINIDTNLTVTTDRRTYYLELHSTKNKAYMAAVQWNYPNDRFVKKYQKTRKVERKKAEKILQITDLTSMNFDYKFKTFEDEEDIEWFPVRAFDDGKKTFIQFPSDMKYRQAPVLYVLSNETNRKPQIVNYRVQDGFYVVDRIFQAAVLMEGTKAQRKVTILNKKIYREYAKYDPFTERENSK